MYVINGYMSKGIIYCLPLFVPSPPLSLALGSRIFDNVDRQYRDILRRWIGYHDILKTVNRHTYIFGSARKSALTTGLNTGPQWLLMARLSW